MFNTVNNVGVFSNWMLTNFTRSACFPWITFFTVIHVQDDDNTQNTKKYGNKLYVNISAQLCNISK